MITVGLKPYSEYRSSGLEWLGEVPAHWDTTTHQTIGNHYERVPEFTHKTFL